MEALALWRQALEHQPEDALIRRRVRLAAAWIVAWGFGWGTRRGVIKHGLQGPLKKGDLLMENLHL